MDDEFRKGHHDQSIVLQPQVFSPTYLNKKYGVVPFVDCVTVYNDEKDQLVICVVNTKAEPNRIAPVTCADSCVEDGILTATPRISRRHSRWLP